MDININNNLFSRIENKYRMTAVFLLYLLGFFQWLYFFRFGSFIFYSFDWPKQYEYYLVLKHALNTHVIPYHISQLIQGTNRFLAIPETNLFPSILLLPFLPIGKIILLHILVMYTLGFVGCFMIMRKFKLSFLPFAFLFFLYNFNGYIVAHLSVGHSMWSGYFLLSIFFYLLFELKEKPKDTFMVLKLSILLFLILLVGAIHIYIWCMMTLFLIILFNWKYLKPISYTIVVSLLLGFFRLVPAFLTFKSGNITFVSGYINPIIFLKALINIKTKYSFVFVNSKSVGWWEFDIFVSILGLIFLIFYGFYNSLKNFNKLISSFNYLIIPLMIITVLSFGDMYGFIGSSLLPFLHIERVSSRFIIIPLIFLFILSSVQMQNFINASKIKRELKLFHYIMLVILFIFLAGNATKWRVIGFGKYIKYSYIGPNVHIISISDIFYKEVFQISVLISLITFIIVSYQLIKHYKKKLFTVVASH